VLLTIDIAMQCINEYTVPWRTCNLKIQMSIVVLILCGGDQLSLLYNLQLEQLDIQNKENIF